MNDRLTTPNHGENHDGSLTRNLSWTLDSRLTDGGMNMVPTLILMIVPSIVLWWRLKNFDRNI